MAKQGQIIAVCTSASRSGYKTDIGIGLPVKGFGLEGGAVLTGSLIESMEGATR
jgi:hypothetical protein